MTLLGVDICLYMQQYLISFAPARTPARCNNICMVQHFCMVLHGAAFLHHACISARSSISAWCNISALCCTVHAFLHCACISERCYIFYTVQYHSIFSTQCRALLHMRAAIVTAHGAAFTTVQCIHVKLSTGHNTRSSCAIFKIPQIKSTESSTFYYVGIKDWKSLPLEIQSLSNKSILRKQSKNIY